MRPSTRRARRFEVWELTRALGRLLSVTALYFITGRRRPYTLLGLSELHAASDGRLTQRLSRWITGIENRVGRARREPDDRPSLFEGPTEPVVRELQREGVAILASRLPEGVCRDLVNFSLVTEATIVGDDGPCGRGAYGAGPPTRSAQYKLDPDQVLSCPAAQAVVADPYLLELAGRYLRSEPVLSSVGMWWNTCRDEAPSSYMGQLFHWDIAGLQWINYFIYLTDVDGDSGPHVFVKRSHVPAPERRDLVRRGTVRVPDPDIVAAYGAEAVFEATGPRGTVVAADTWGFHKAKSPLSRDRLVLQVMFN
ncbi:MAG: phytanoyl-CoA dioxygenase family protein, partial [Acidimicrobiales bacterium]